MGPITQTTDTNPVFVHTGSQVHVLLNGTAGTRPAKAAHHLLNFENELLSVLREGDVALGARPDFLKDTTILIRTFSL